MMLLKNIAELNEKLAADVYEDRFYARLDNIAGQNLYAVCVHDRKTNDTRVGYAFNKYQLQFRDNQDDEYRQKYIDYYIMNEVRSTMNLLITHSDFWPTHRGLIRNDKKSNETR